MKKLDAIALLSPEKKTGAAAANALGVNPQTFKGWPDELTPQQADQVRGCYTRIAAEREQFVAEVLGNIA